MLQRALIFMTTRVKNDEYNSNNMIDVSSEIVGQVDGQALTLPETVRPHDRTWLRFLFGLLLTTPLSLYSIFSSFVLLNLLPDSR